ncbi:MAG: hypothetical protein C4527_18515 [Candidatus Omnitrophota bacterium]|jgi:tetratricopeptide (TPR) repeat protein|nr:MAG: hypothetical protein C4527_18515 [Candidatus Omnitrophota bacterium]
MKMKFLCSIILGILAPHFTLAAGDWGGQYDFPQKPIIQNPDSARQEQYLFDSLAQHPDHPTTLLALAQLYHSQQYYPQAIAVLERTIAKHPRLSQAHFLLGKILGYQKTDPDRSTTELEVAIRLDPDSIEYRNEAAAVYYRLQRFPPAIKHLEEILKRDPQNEEALYRKAIILYTRGEIEEAEAITDRLPHYEHARILKALLVQQRNEDAKPLFEAILHDHPDNLRARYEYGKILMKEKKFQEARERFEKIIDEEPFYQHAVFQLVKVYSFMKEKEKAQLAKQSLDTINQIGRNQRNFYRSFLRHHPDTAETHYAMALIYLEIGRGNLAAMELHRVLEFEPHHKDAPFYLAQISMAGGEYEKAISHLEACLQVREDTATIHAMMTQCFLELHNGPQAREHLETALRLDPKNSLGLHILDLWKQQAAKQEN